MKRSPYTEEQIIRAIKQHESGVKTQDICRELGIVEQTLYKWKTKFGGMDVSEALNFFKIYDSSGSPLPANNRRFKTSR